MEIEDEMSGHRRGSDKEKCKKSGSDLMMADTTQMTFDIGRAKGSGNQIARKSKLYHSKLTKQQFPSQMGL